MKDLWRWLVLAIVALVSGALVLYYVLPFVQDRGFVWWLALMPALVAAALSILYFAYYLLHPEGRKVGLLRGIGSLAVAIAALAVGAAVWYFVPCSTAEPPVCALGAVLGVFAFIAVASIFDPEATFLKWGAIRPAHLPQQVQADEPGDGSGHDESEKQHSVLEASGALLAISVLVGLPIYLHGLIGQIQPGVLLSEDDVVAVSILVPPLLVAAVFASLSHFEGSSDPRQRAVREAFLTVALLTCLLVVVEWLFQPRRLAQGVDWVWRAALYGGLVGAVLKLLPVFDRGKAAIQWRWEVFTTRLMSR